MYRECNVKQVQVQRNASKVGTCTENKVSKVSTYMEGTTIRECKVSNDYRLQETIAGQMNVKRMCVRVSVGVRACVCARAPICGCVYAGVCVCQNAGVCMQECVCMRECVCAKMRLSKTRNPVTEP